jgi:hypothetical protein
LRVTRKRCPCGAVFTAYHGNQRYCSKGCPKRKKHRPAGLPSRVVFPPRCCDYCGREFLPHASHQRFCCYSHQLAGRRPEERLLYHNPQHRRERRAWAPIVAEGGVICAGPNGCQKPIIPGIDAWDLGHMPDGSRHPQHSKCNRRTAGKRAELSRAW